jgi:hypothetical protein
MGKDGTSPGFPRLQAVEEIEVRPLRVEHAFALEGRDGSDKLCLAVGEIVEELALAGHRARPNVIQACSTDATRQNEVCRRSDDTRTGGRAPLGVSFASVMPDTMPNDLD